MQDLPDNVFLTCAARLCIWHRTVLVPAARGGNTPPFAGPYFRDIDRSVPGVTTVFTVNGGERSFADTDLVLVTDSTGF